MASGKGKTKDGEGEAAVDGELTPKKKWSGKKIVMIAVPALVVLGGGGFAATSMLGGGDEEAHADAASAEHGEVTAEGGVVIDPDAATVYLDVPDIMVNLKSLNRKASYLKLSVSLEVPSQAEADAINAKLPVVIDEFQIYLRELRVEDLSGSAGMFRLKEELLRRVNLGVSPLRVSDVLFKEMLVQ